MKTSLMLPVLLLCAVSAQAQHNHQPPTGGGSGGGFGNNVGWGGGSVWGSSGSHAAGRAVRYEDPRSYSLQYARNDGPFVATTYMSYEDAVALGQQQLAAAEKASQGEGTPSLGDVARSFRAVRVPTMKLQSRVLQDDAGRLEVCNLNDNNCHRP